MDKALESGNYKDGKLSGAVYRKFLFMIHWLYQEVTVRIDGGEDMENIIVDAFRKYCVSNPLHPDAFPDSSQDGSGGGVHVSEDVQ